MVNQIKGSNQDTPINNFKPDILSNYINNVETLFNPASHLKNIKSKVELVNLICSLISETFNISEVVLTQATKGGLKVSNCLGIDNEQFKLKTMTMDTDIVFNLLANQEIKLNSEESDFKYIFHHLSQYFETQIIGILPIKKYNQLTHIIFIGNPTGEKEITDKNLKPISIFTQYIGRIIEAFDLMTNVTDGQNKLFSIFQSVSDGLIYTNPDFEVSIINSSAKDMFHFLNNIDEGNNIAPIFSQSSLTISLEELIQHVKNASVDLEFKNQGLVYSTDIERLYTSDNEIDGYLFVFKDITKQRHTENLKTIFLSTLSHKLRTPLQILNLNLNLISHSKICNQDSEIKDCLERAIKQSKNLTRIILSLLDLTNFSNEQMSNELKKQNIIIKDLLDKICIKHTNSAKDKKIKLIKNYSDTSIQCLFNEESMIKSIGHIVENAIKFNPEKTQISIKLSKTTDKAIITIEDNGIGISNEAIAYIFDSFVQVEKYMTGKVEGIGIGLYIAREIIKSQGGVIVCASEVNQGTKFTITLPLV
ncbi:MAG: ATP-binding protein [Pseudomonadota bacterium]